jgi:hypothetical protein
MISEVASERAWAQFWACADGVISKIMLPQVHVVGHNLATENKALPLSSPTIFSRGGKPWPTSDSTRSQATAARCIP